MGFHYPHAVKHSLATAANDFIVASGAGVFVKKTLAEVKTLLGLGTAAYTAATDYVTHALATAANDFLVASGSGAYVKKTLAETLTILAHSIASHSDTTATGAELETLTDGSETELHSHAADGVTLTIAETEVFSGTSPDPIAWTDLDLSGTIGTQATLVILKFFNPAGAKQWIAVKRNGDTDLFYTVDVGTTGGDLASEKSCILLVTTDATGKIEWKYEGAGQANITFDLLAYIK